MNDIKQGNVLCDEKGQLFVAVGLIRDPHTRRIGWRGFGFNGNPISTFAPELIADNINRYIRDYER